MKLYTSFSTTHKALFREFGIRINIKRAHFATCQINLIRIHLLMGTRFSLRLNAQILHWCIGRRALDGVPQTVCTGGCALEGVLW